MRKITKLKILLFIEINNIIENKIVLFLNYSIINIKRIFSFR